VLRSRSGHMRPPHIVRFVQSSTDDGDASSMGVYSTGEERGRGFVGCYVSRCVNVFRSVKMHAALFD
jgi:hypothetical protein